MKKFIACFLALVLILSFAGCKNDKETESETTTAVSEAETNSETAKEELLQNAREAYAAFIVQKISEVPDPEGSPDSALVLDLDGNGIPEVVCRSGNANETYILSYGENDGMNVIIPHYGSFEKVYFSKENRILYYTNMVSTTSFLSFCTGGCYKAETEGFQTVGTVLGKRWGDEKEGVPNDSILFNQKLADKYDKGFDESIKSLVGDADFTEYDKVCVEENVWEYLSEELSINLTEKKAEYDEFKAKATAAVGEDNLISINVSDFDRNGTFEAFILIGQENDTDNINSSYNGKVLFVDENRNIEILSEQDNFINLGFIEACQYHNYFDIKYESSSHPTLLLATVSDGKCSVISDFSDANYFNESSDDTINSISFTYDSSNEDSPYEPGGLEYYYYDTPDGLREYGGVEISLEQFEKLGGTKCLEQMESENYTYKIKNIYLRGNGIINMNLSDGTYKCSATFRITCCGIEMLTMYLTSDGFSEYGLFAGQYSPAATPNLAVYPDLADFGL